MALCLVNGTAGKYQHFSLFGSFPSPSHLYFYMMYRLFSFKALLLLLLSFGHSACNERSSDAQSLVPLAQRWIEASDVIGSVSGVYLTGAVYEEKWSAALNLVNVESKINKR